MGSSWEEASAAARSIAAPVGRRLATTIREAADALVVSVMTCPPAYWQRIQSDTVPDRYQAIIDRISAHFIPRVEAAGEDWRFALRRFGLVYAPLSSVEHRPLADELRRTLLAPEGIDGWLVGYFVSRAQLLLGFIVVGTRDPDPVALDRVREPLTTVVRQAGTTLETTLELAGGCGVIVPALDAARHPLTPREQQIADLVAQGYSNVNVAARLALSANTVGVHVRKIYRKLGVHSRIELSDALQRWRA